MHIFAFFLVLSILAMVGLIAYVYWRIRHRLREIQRPLPPPPADDEAIAAPRRT